MTITNEDVAAAKAKGDANNDWKLTHSLIMSKKEGDAEAPTLEKVFWRMYFGVCILAYVFWRMCWTACACVCARIYF